jgi:hypothetical protein
MILQIPHRANTAPYEVFRIHAVAVAAQNQANSRCLDPPPPSSSSSSFCLLLLCYGDGGVFIKK